MLISIPKNECKINPSEWHIYPLNKDATDFSSDGFLNRTLHDDVINDALDNIVRVSDEVHRAIYFLAIFELGQWHHSEICFTERTASC